MEARTRRMRTRNPCVFAITACSCRVDFDISPCFAIFKPALVHGFDYLKLHGANAQRDPARSSVWSQAGAELSNRLAPESAVDSVQRFIGA
jgi:hypothetical protein